MNQETLQHPKTQRGSGLLALLLVTTGMTFLCLCEYVLFRQTIAADGLELVPLAVGSGFTCASVVLVLVVTLLLIRAMERRLSFGVLCGCTVGVVLGLMGGLMASAKYDALVLDAIEFSHSELPDAVRAYAKDHGELPGHVSMLVPDYLDVLPEVPDFCTRVELSTSEDRWALISDCNMQREPHSPHDIVYGHHDTVHRLIYKGHTRRWHQGSRGHQGCFDWDPDLRITPDMMIEGQVNF